MEGLEGGGLPCRVHLLPLVGRIQLQRLRVGTIQLFGQRSNVLLQHLDLQRFVRSLLFNSLLVLDSHERRQSGAALSSDLAYAKSFAISFVA